MCWVKDPIARLRKAMLMEHLDVFRWYASCTPRLQLRTRTGGRMNRRTERLVALAGAGLGNG
jgi:hypothetical protein